MQTQFFQKRELERKERFTNDGTRTIVRNITLTDPSQPRLELRNIQLQTRRFGNSEGISII